MPTMLRIKCLFFLVLYQVVAVTLLLCVVEFALKRLDRPTTVVTPTYYTNLLGDFEPNLRVISSVPSNYPYIFTTNSQGFRGLEEVTAAKPQQTLRILCLGDSYTMGWGVDDAQTYPERLKQELEAKYPSIHFEVVNAGLLFSNILDQMDYFFDKGYKLDPDLVILQYCYNDVDTDFIRDSITRQAGRLYANKEYKHSFINGVQVALQNTAIANAGAYINALIYKEKMKDSKSVLVGYPESIVKAIPKDSLNACLLTPTSEELRYTGGREFSVLKEENIEGLKRFWDMYNSLLVRFSRELGSRDIPFLFVAMPNQLEMEHDWNAQSCVFSQNTRQHDIAYIDLTHVFREAVTKDTSQHFLRADGHLSSDGNALAARAIASRLELVENAASHLRLAFRPEAFTRDCNSTHTLDFRDCKERLCLRPALEPDGDITEVEIKNNGLQFNEDADFLTPQGGEGELVVRIAFARPFHNLDILSFRRVFNDAVSRLSLSTSLDGEQYTERYVYLADDSGKWDGKENAKVVELRGDGRQHQIFLRFSMKGKAGLVFDAPDAAKELRALKCQVSF